MLKVITPKRAVLGLGLLVAAGCAGLGLGSRGVAIPTSTGASNSTPDSVVCTTDLVPPHFGPTVVSDFSDGVSSDGRGPYIQGADGVRTSIVLNFAALTIDGQKPGITNPRTITVNLNHPVPGGGGVPLGVISDGNDNGLHTQWRRAGMVTKSLDSIPVGQTVTAAQMNVTFHVNGHFHVLQIGSQPFGHCHVGTNLVHGRGTSSGTIYRASRTKWVIDLPVGSVGRLFDLSHTTLHAVDKGLYYVHLHYEIGN